MRIKCVHGYFFFQETNAGQMSDFLSAFPFDMVSQDDYFTFSFLAGAPNYSIEGSTYLGAIATKTFAGNPWDIMRENELVYDFNLNMVLPKTTVTQLFKVKSTDRYHIASGLILPGSLTDEGQRVTDYSAWLLFDQMKFKYSELILD